jgi:Uncharacterized protein conserved in bacteria (DUF2252)
VRSWIDHGTEVVEEPSPSLVRQLVETGQPFWLDIENLTGEIIDRLARQRPQRERQQPRAARRGLAPGSQPRPYPGLVMGSWVRQLCGDAHLSNFGAFASPERRLVFDVNDFDETLPGPFEWDVKRLAASLAVAGRDNGFGGRDRRQVVVAAVEGYRTAMRAFAGQHFLDVWYAHLDVEGTVREVRSQLKRRGVKLTAKMVAKAHTQDSMRALSKGIVRGSVPASVVPASGRDASGADVTSITIQFSIADAPVADKTKSGIRRNSGRSHLATHSSKLLTPMSSSQYMSQSRTSLSRSSTSVPARASGSAR